MTSLVVAALLFFLTAQDWGRADLETKRLPPSAFSNLPPDIRSDLDRRGCSIPQGRWLTLGGGD